MVTICDVWGEKNKVLMLCSFSYEYELYAIFADAEHEEPILEKLEYSLWDGPKRSLEGVDDEVLHLGNQLLEKARSNAEKYPMCGEHYEIYESKSRGIRVKRRRRHAVFGKTMSLLSNAGRWAVGMLFAYLYFAIYVQLTGLQWGAFLFPEAEAEEILLYLGIIQFVGTNLLFFIRKNDRNLVDLGLYSVSPLNVITFFLATQVSKTAFWILIAVSAISVVLFVLPNLFRAIFNASRSACRRVFVGLCFAFGVTGIVVTVCGVYFGATVSPARIIEESAYHGEENMDARFAQATVNIREDTWQTLTAQERIDTMQAICDHECISVLGCESVPVVSAEIKDDGVLGLYNSKENRIVIDQAHLMESNVQEAVETILHETRHVWQCTMVKLYKSVDGRIDDRFLNLQIFRQAEAFMKNFENYTSGTVDFEEYAEQIVEADSRDWSQSRMYSVYLDYITAASNHREE